MEGKPDWLPGFPVQIYCNRSEGSRCHPRHPAADNQWGGYCPARGSLRWFSLYWWARCRSPAVWGGHGALLRRAVPCPGRSGAGAAPTGFGAGQAHPGHLPGHPVSECGPGGHSLWKRFISWGWNNAMRVEPYSGCPFVGTVWKRFLRPSKIVRYSQRSRVRC